MIEPQTFRQRLVASIRLKMLEYLTISLVRELEISKAFELICWFLYFLALFFCMLDPGIMPTYIKHHFEDATIPLVVSSFFLSTASFAWMMALVSIKRLRKSRIAVNMGVYMTKAFTYIVYPVALRFSFRLLAGQTLLSGQNQLTWLVITAAILAVIISTIQAIVGSRGLKNPLPTSSLVFTSMEPNVENVCFWTENLLIVLIELITFTAPTRLVLGLNLAVLVFITGLILWLTLSKRIFWNPKANSVFSTGLFAVNFLKLIVIMKCNNLLFPGQYFPYSVWLLTIPCFAKISSNRTEVLGFIDLAHSGATKEDVKRAFYFFEESYVKLRDGDRTPSNLKIFAYYYGAFKRKIEAYEANEEEVAAHLGAVRDEFHLKCVKYMGERYGKAPEFLDIQAYIMLNLIVPHMSVCVGVLNALKKASKKAFFADLKYSLLHYLFELKMKSLYKGKIKDDDRETVSLRNSFDTIMETSNYMKEENYLDIHLPIRAKNQYIEFCDQVKKLLGIHDQLFRELNSGIQLKYSKIIEKNKESLKIAKIIEGIIQEFKKEVFKKNLFVGYYFSGIMVYLKTIRHSSSDAVRLFKLYKIRRQLLLQSSSKGEITSSNLFKDCVVLEVNLQKERIGEITDHSVDYAFHIGEPKDKKGIKGLNINLFMMESLREIHLQYMKNFQKFFQLNQQREYFIIGFNDELYEVRFVVKILPKLVDTLKAVIYLRRLHKPNDKMAIVNKDMQVVASHSKLNAILEKCDLNSSTFDLKQLSSTLCHYIQLFSAFYKLIAKFPRYSPIKEHAFSSEFAGIFEQIKFINKAQGLTFLVDETSPCAELLIGFALVANIEYAEFKNIEFTKVYLKFKTVENKSQRQGLADNIFKTDQQSSSGKRRSGQISKRDMLARNPSFSNNQELFEGEGEIDDRLNIDFYIGRFYEAADRYGLLNRRYVQELDTGDKVIQRFIDCLALFDKVPKPSSSIDLNLHENRRYLHLGVGKRLVVIDEINSFEEQSPQGFIQPQPVPTEQKTATFATKDKSLDPIPRHVPAIRNQEEQKQASQSSNNEKLRQGTRKKSTTKIRIEILELIHHLSADKTGGVPGGSKNSGGKSITKTSLAQNDSWRQFYDLQHGDDGNPMSALLQSKKNRITGLKVQSVSNPKDGQRKKSENELQIPSSAQPKKRKSLGLLATTYLINRLLNMALVVACNLEKKNRPRPLFRKI